MSAELECGSEASGRYTCKYAPKPSVCCANGCCATKAATVTTHRPLQLWARIVIALSIGLAMVLIFCLLRYRDRRGYRAYKRLRKHQRAQGAAEMQVQTHASHNGNEGETPVAARSHEPMEPRDA